MTRSPNPTGMHDWHSDTYVEDWIGNWERDERRAALRRLVSLIPVDPDSDVRVLDIGGGWGPVTRAVLEAYPRAQVTMHDFSEPMLENARERLAMYSDSVTFVRGDLMTPEWKANIKGQFDAIVTSLCIHNVRYPDRIHAIYNEIFPLVGPGGCFLSLDQAPYSNVGARANRHAQLMDKRRQLADETGQTKTLAEVNELVPARAQSNRESDPRMESHERATLNNQLRWLSEAGFDTVECFGREGGSALIGAFRT